MCRIMLQCCRCVIVLMVCISGGIIIVALSNSAAYSQVRPDSETLIPHCVAYIYSYDNLNLETQTYVLGTGDGAVLARGPELSGSFNSDAPDLEFTLSADVNMSRVEVASPSEVTSRPTFSLEQNEFTTTESSETTDCRIIVEERSREQFTFPVINWQGWLYMGKSEADGYLISAILHDNRTNSSFQMPDWCEDDGSEAWWGSIKVEENQKHSQVGFPTSQLFNLILWGLLRMLLCSLRIISECSDDTSSAESTDNKLVATFRFFESVFGWLFLGFLIAPLKNLTFQGCPQMLVTYYSQHMQRVFHYLWVIIFPAMFSFLISATGCAQRENMGNSRLAACIQLFHLCFPIVCLLLLVAQFILSIIGGILYAKKHFWLNFNFNINFTLMWPEYWIGVRINWLRVCNTLLILLDILSIIIAIIDYVISCRSPQQGSHIDPKESTRGLAVCQRCGSTIGAAGADNTSNSASSIAVVGTTAKAQMQNPPNSADPVGTTSV